MAKTPDGLTLIPWKAGKALTSMQPLWTHAASYLKASSVSPGQAAEVAAVQKKAKYSAISTNHWFIPVAVAVHFLTYKLGDKCVAYCSLDVAQYPLKMVY